MLVNEPVSGHDPATKAPEVFTISVTFGSQLSVAAGNIACAAAIPVASLHCKVVFKAPAVVDQPGGVLSISVIT